LLWHAKRQMTEELVEVLWAYQWRRNY